MTEEVQNTETAADAGQMNANTTFVSHASEDKKYVKNLVDTLLRYQIKVWYDDYEIDVGDSIRTKINEGLTQSDYGVVVFSHNFFKKKWPKKELASLDILLEEGRLLPVLYEITIDEVRAYDALSSDIKAVTTQDVTAVAGVLARKIKGKGVEKAGQRLIYRNQTLSILDVPMSETLTITNVSFHDCVIQGPAILYLHDRVTLEDMTFNDEFTFVPRIPDRPIVGAIGIENVRFKRCRFKDIGVFQTLEEIEILMMAMPRQPDDYEVPEHLQ
ncbi:TIR domain-containing protein [Rathayibacter sp. PhB127]|uniref:toll/interleukin-1 receptor domain-containing protein n=1 Tax=Rathayibacter sp. PhB127 TaxID=2485176 RepID=UPI000F4CC5B0|nr:toll/interleukin-1 receptor domain-containing protein [Rathayibacter sp. PhB127]ROS29585.1 TIR domain-containing protein [Rathayibacter sp. PhB127]